SFMGCLLLGHNLITLQVHDFHVPEFQSDPIYPGCQQSLYQHLIFLLELLTSSQVDLVRRR
ncbi:MAG: hypothetical protein NZ707_02185, partial [Rhodospirillales bacterium]|nr:hypothetical protein [Rhodospirillales bacterium]